MKKSISGLPSIIGITILSVLFFWKFFLRGLIPFPGDLMVGAYYPWLEEKWGYVVGVPVKNPLISDVFSQLYIWKMLIADSIKSLEWPLWNPYSYSGYPLLANFQSGFLNPMNLLMVIFNSPVGWALMMFGQIFGSTLCMYLFIRSLGGKKLSSLVGAVTYGFSGFAVAWMEFATIGQAMIWIPLLFLVIEKSANTKSTKYLAWTPLLFLFIVGSGHFQALIYAAILSGTYFIYRLRPFSKIGRRYRLPAIAAVVLSVSMSCIQLVPTIELMNRSVRFGENYIKNVNYGLLPLANISSIVAPDIFGNATTGNYWGVFNYQESIFYAGVLGAIALMFSLFNYKKMGVEKYFVFAAVLSLFFAFDTPLGKAVYIFNVPGLSTSAAGRAGLVFVFSIGVLVSRMLDSVGSLSLKDRLKWPFFWILIIGVSGTILFLTNKLFVNDPYNQYLNLWINNTKVGMRNLVIPFGLVCAFFGLFAISRKIKLWQYGVLAVVVLDLFRFGWKYTPFVPEQMIFPEMPSISYLQSDKDVFRVEKERAEILPPNTWAGYQLMSPSGYDPMAVSDYVKSFNKDLNENDSGEVSRYSEIDRYSASALGKYNVKYLLAIKRDETDRIPGNNINYRIDKNDWERVNESPVVSTLRNRKYLPRARIVDNEGDLASGSATISHYEKNKVVINFENISGERLLLADAWYPGWTAKLDGKTEEILSDIKPFRSIKLDKTTGSVVFEYKPESFRVGGLISLAGLIGWVLWMIKARVLNKS